MSEACKYCGQYNENYKCCEILGIHEDVKKCSKVEYYERGKMSMIKYESVKLQEAYENGRADAIRDIRRELIESDLVTFSQVVDYLIEQEEANRTMADMVGGKE